MKSISNWVISTNLKGNNKQLSQSSSFWNNLIWNTVKKLLGYLNMNLLKIMVWKQSNLVNSHYLSDTANRIPHVYHHYTPGVW